MEKWLFTPFTYVAGWKALLIGLAGIATTAFIGYLLTIHFDGPLSVHIGLDIPFYIFLTESAIAWISLSCIFYVSGSLLSKSSIRFIDVAGTIALARIPVVLTALGLLPGIKIFNPTSFYLMPVFFLFMLPSIWMVILYYNAFKISCNIKGFKLIAAFVAGIYLAEIISKITVVQLYKLLL